MEKQRKTFLSYSRANKDFAVRLARELKSEGFDIWLDQLDIPAGARWDREVEKALKECEIFMIIITPASIDSENVLDEIGYAIDTHKRILPVLLEKSDVPLRLRRLQYVDFTNKSFDEGVESAKELLRELISQETMPRIALSDAEKKQLAQEEADRKVNNVAEHRAGRGDETRTRTEETAEPISLEVAEKRPASKIILYSVGVIVALALLAGLFSLLSRRGSAEAPIATLTPEAIANVPVTEAPVTVVPTQLPETEVLATETPGITQAPLLEFSDPFDDNSMGWVTGATDSDNWDGTRSVTNGYYLWDVTLVEDEDFTSRVAYPGQEASIENFDVSVDIRRLAGTPENACYGLFFRETPAGDDYVYYRFLACDDQTYQISYRGEQESANLRDWTEIDLIRIGDWNNLRVVGNGNEFAFYINNELVLELSDSRVPRGDIGLIIGWYDSEPGQISFDNFQLLIK